MSGKISKEYELPVASTSTLGGVKVGSGLSISNGVLSAAGGGLSIFETGTFPYGNNKVVSVTLSEPATLVIVAGYCLIPGQETMILQENYGSQFRFRLSSDGTKISTQRHTNGNTPETFYIALK